VSYITTGSRNIALRLLLYVAEDNYLFLAEQSASLHKDVARVGKPISSVTQSINKENIPPKYA
jgi:hypothetical protein